MLTAHCPSRRGGIISYRGLSAAEAERVLRLASVGSKIINASGRVVGESWMEREGGGWRKLWYIESEDRAQEGENAPAR